MMTKDDSNISFLNDLIDYVGILNANEISFEEKYSVEQINQFEEYTLNKLDIPFDKFVTELSHTKLKSKLNQSSKAIKEATCFNSSLLDKFEIYDMNTEPDKLEFSFHETKFGLIVIASTSIGICHIAFEENKEIAFAHLSKRYSQSQLIENENLIHNLIQVHIHTGKVIKNSITLHLKATHFQLEVWKALLCIPSSMLVTYTDIANYMNKPNGSRAVGTAIGDNPIAYLIPCHRVLPVTGVIGEYAWGSARKSILIASELAKGI